MLKLLFATLATLGLASAPAFAQFTKIFLASTGVDSNDGSRASPKRTLQAAHDAVAAGGELVVLDTAGYGALTITKSVSVVVPPGVSGFITVSDANANGVTISAGASDSVTLRGLIIEGGAKSAGDGVLVTSVGSLFVADVTVRNFSEGLFVLSTVSANVVVRSSAFRNNVYGVDIESSGPNVAITALITDTEVSGASYSAFYVNRSYTSSSSHLTTTRCAVNGAGYAFSAYGATAQIVADGCSVTGAGTVFSINNQATIYSRGNNTIFGNGSLGSTPTSLAGQ